MPHSKPDWTSRTSSLNRFSVAIAPFQMTVPSRRKRTFDPRVMTPLRTKQPATLPTRGTPKTSRTSASPVTTSSNSGCSMPTSAALTSSSTW